MNRSKKNFPTAQTTSASFGPALCPNESVCRHLGAAWAWAWALWWRVLTERGVVEVWGGEMAAAGSTVVVVV
jgi:hypothetical protein